MAKHFRSSAPKGPHQRVPGADREASFQAWYGDRAAKLGLDANPDDPRHFYDYRAAYRAGDEPAADGHWPSTHKKVGHPQLVVDGKDTRTGKPAYETESYAYNFRTRNNLQRGKPKAKGAK
jgi:hypothetical protein